MVANTIIGTGGDMSQIHRTALNINRDVHEISPITNGLAIVLEDTIDPQIIDVNEIAEIDMAIEASGVFYLEAIPVIVANTIEVVHQYATLSDAGTASDKAINHIE